MATIEKFQFGVDFDAPAPAQVRAPDAPPPPPSYSGQELEAAKQAAYAAGREAGMAEAARGIERQTAQALTAIGAALEQAGTSHAAVLESCRADALTLAAAVARKLAPAMVRRDAVAAVESLVAEILPQAIDEPRLVVRAGVALIEGLKDRIDTLATRSGYHGRLILLGDEALAGADCRIEWADGGAEHDSGRLAAEIDATVQRFLHGVGGDAPAVPDMPLNDDTQEIRNG